jgi:tetratricopeptide (TPR) repeat protein
VRRAGLAVGTLLLLARPAAAQDTTAVLLREARARYEELDLEHALPLLRQVVSPQWTFPLTLAQRVEAYTYLGAALSLVGQPDSAVAYFRAALARDPFADLDPVQFTPGQLFAFAAARRGVFGVGARPVAAARADVRTERIRFTVATTHAAALDVLLEPIGTGIPPYRVFTAESEGVRDVPWDGLLAEGRLAPPGRYALLVVARSLTLGRTDTARVFFQAAYEVVTLEDTLRAIPRRALLPEYEKARGAGSELLKGAGVAMGALLASAGLANHHLGAGVRGGAAVVAGAGIAVGLGGFVARSRQRAEILDNVAANRQREADRRAANDAILRRNADRLAQTILLVKPAAGVGP